MISNIICSLSRTQSLRCIFQTRKYHEFQVTVVGAATKVGSNVSELLKAQSKISRLKLHDFNSEVLGVAKSLSTSSVGPGVCGFAGEGELESAVAASHLVLLVYNASSSEMDPMKQASENAPYVRAVCAALACCNPTAVLGISTDPVNVMVPYASDILDSYNCLEPKKVIGITNAGAHLAKVAAANALGAKAKFLSIPVIGGHSPNSIVPLFSRLEPKFYTLSKKQMKELTNIVRESFPTTPQARDNAASKDAWAIYEFTTNIIDALGGQTKELHCYTRNPNFGTKFLSGPTILGPVGVAKPANYLSMSQDEINLFMKAVQCINADIAYAERLSNEAISIPT